jgi:chondroitin 4-sulfotransferase 11
MPFKRIKVLRPGQEGSTRGRRYMGSGKQAAAALLGVLEQRYFRRYVFVHINKTGGTSIEKALGIRSEHMTALEKKRQLGEKAWEAKFRFSIVRNPWDKVVSHYLYRVKTNQTGLGGSAVGFQTWVRRAYGERDTEFYDNPRMFQPQIDWITDHDGTVLVNFVGRFENLTEDFGRICSQIGIVAELPHLKKTDRRRYDAYYDDSTRQIVSDWFKEDIELFGYEF